MFFSSSPRRRIKLLPVLFIPVVFTSCLTLKNYDRNKPFVYKTIIRVHGAMEKEETKAIENGLQYQLHDSLRNRVKTKLFLWKSIDRPRIYNSVNADKSLPAMSNYLHLRGYFRDSIYYSSIIETKGHQKRVIISFDVVPGKLFVLDSIRYNLAGRTNSMKTIDTIQQLVTSTADERLLRKGNAFSTIVISSELERIANLCRNNGFLKFNSQQLIVLWDTTKAKTSLPIIDPVKVLETERGKIDSPKADIEIRLEPSIDTSRLMRYYVGNIKVYPDLGIDTLSNTPKITSFKKLNTEFISYGNRFRPAKLLPFIHLTHGDIYRQKDFIKTVNRLNKLTAWRAVDILQLPRAGKDTVDFEIRMVPAEKYKLRLGLDVSHNLSSNVSEGNLIGLGTNLILTDRCLAKGPNHSVTHVRYGFEMSPLLDSIQSKQFLVNHTISFPRLIPRFIRFPKIPRDEVSTYLSLSASSTNRIDFYDLKTLVFSWGYRFNRKNMDIGFRFPNIEFNLLEKKRGLEQLIKENASYQHIFNDGFISSIILNATIQWNRKSVFRTLKLGTEESGWFAGIFHAFIPDIKLYRFLKLDVEYTEGYKIRNTSFNWRFFGAAGYGIPFSNATGKSDSLNYYMPFFRQYYVGGSSSMRAWPVRKLGPGSALKSYSPEIAPERYGDMKLELNMEYRFQIARLWNYPIEGALFIDCGNIWYLRKNHDFVNGEINFNRFFKDIAVGMGTGLRVDLKFMMIRTDYSYKAKNPSPDINDAHLQNHWFANWDPWGGQVQLAFSYPF